MLGCEDKPIPSVPEHREYFSLGMVLFKSEGK
jgi:hypothetical protein